MAQTTAPVPDNPFDQIRILNEGRTEYFSRVIEQLADHLEEVLSRRLSDLSIKPRRPEEVLVHELASPDTDITLVTSDYHLGNGLIVSDLHLALPMITIMCGGNPGPQPEIRPLTRVEAGVYELVLDPILRQSAELFGVGPSTLGYHISGPSALPAESHQPGVAISLEVTLGDIEGTITVGFTATQLQFFIEDIDRRLAGRQAQRNDQPNAVVAKASRLVPLELVVGFEPARVPAGVLAELQEGDVLRTGQMIAQSLVARIGTERIVSVRAAQRGQRLVAEVTGRIASNEGVT